jgi:hypothetical protein
MPEHQPQEHEVERFIGKGELAGVCAEDLGAVPGPDQKALLQIDAHGQPGPQIGLQASQGSTGTAAEIEDARAGLQAQGDQRRALLGPDAGGLLLEPLRFVGGAGGGRRVARLVTAGEIRHAASGTRAGRPRSRAWSRPYLLAT